MIIAETKLFAENITAEVIVADAASFNKIVSDSFFFIYEI